MYATLNKLCGELKESHLVALEPRRAHEFRTDHRAGIGIRMRMIEGALVVIDVLPNGPAGRAGVQTGWRVRTRNGEPLGETSTYVARVGVPVSFGFDDRDGAERQVTLQPELLQFDQTVARDLPGGWRYLRFDRFDDTSLDWFRADLKQHKDGPGVVIDLRFNGGGLASACELAVADFFDRRVPVGRQVERTGRAATMQRRAFFPVNYPGKVIVLVSVATGSAAEIFAHALQWHHRARVVGQKTAGAVIVSRYFGLPGGGRLQVPILDFIGLDGQRLEGRGVTPDLVVPEPTLQQCQAGEDPVLRAALGAYAGPAPTSGDRPAG